VKSRIYAIIGSIALGGIPIFVKLIGEGMPIMSVSFFRVFFAFLFLLLVVPFIDKNTFHVKKKHLLMYILIGFLFALTLTMFNIASLLIPVQNSVLINSSGPIFVLLFAYLILKEKVTKPKVLTICLSLIGLAIINPIEKGEFLYGSILALLGSVTYGLLITLMRKEDKCETIGAVVWFFFFASLFTLPFPFIFGLGSSNLIEWVYLIGLSVISTGIAYLMINLALEAIEAEIVSLYTTILLPITAIMLSLIIFKEALNFRILLGGLFLVGAGIYMQIKCTQLEEEKLPLLQGYK
jgi:drug/metabolite transporter (DMT)-like permease